MFCGVWEQSHEACLLQGSTQAALMLGAGTRFTAGFDLPAIRNVPFHETACIFIVNFTHMIVAELTHFAAR
jgi:hypothetical protein